MICFIAGFDHKTYSIIHSIGSANWRLVKYNFSQSEFLIKHKHLTRYFRNTIHKI